MNRTIGLALVATVAAVIPSFAEQGAPGAEQRVAALKQSLQESQQRLRQYEWVETTIVSLKGDEKARTQKRCYYGVDGKVQKTAIGGAPEPKAEPAGGRRGGRLKAKIVENKKSDIQEYMERAAALIHRYVPPAPAQIQKVKDAGNLTLVPSAQTIRLDIKDYLQAGDRLSVDVDAAANTLAAVNIATYLDKTEDSVVLAVRFGSLADGTNYVAQATLDAKAKDIQVVIQNSGHRPHTQ